MVPPMLKQPSGFGCDAPVVRIAKASPLIHLTADLIDHRRNVVLLILGGKPHTFVQDELLLRLCRLCFLGFGMGVMNSAPRRLATTPGTGARASPRLSAEQRETPD